MTIVETMKSVGARMTMGDDDVRAMMKNDHDEIKDLLGGMVDGQQGRSRMQLLDKLKSLLVAHSRAEEKVVYDAMIGARAKQDVRVLAEEGYVEHGVVDDLLVRISRLDAGKGLWLAHAKVIREMLEHHIDEEQNQVFAQLGDLFSRDELAAMGQEFLRRKARVLAQQASKIQRSVARVIAGRRGTASTRPTPAKKARAKTGRSTARGAATSKRSTRRAAR